MAVGGPNKQSLEIAALRGSFRCSLKALPVHAFHWFALTAIWGQPTNSCGRPPPRNSAPCQSRVAFGEARGKVYRNPSIAIRRRAYNLSSTVLLKLLYGAGILGSAQPRGAQAPSGRFTDLTTKAWKHPLLVLSSAYQALRQHYARCTLGDFPGRPSLLQWLRRWTWSTRGCRALSPSGVRTSRPFQKCHQACSRR